MFPLPPGVKAENILSRAKKIEESLEPSEAILVMEQKKHGVSVGGEGNTYKSKKRKSVFSKVGKGVVKIGKNVKANLMLNVGTKSRTI